LADLLLLALPPTKGTLVTRVPTTPEEESAMTKTWAVLVMLVSFLLAAPVIESGTSGSTQMFQAIGTAEGGGD
jgi:hypothetical protein